MNIQDIISSSILLLYVISIIMYFKTKDIYHLIIALGLWATAGISEDIKYHIIGTRSPRPEGAFNCNLLCNDGDQEGRPGMPSSHAAVVTFFAIIYWNYTKNPYIRAMLISYYFLILQSRYFKKCHSISQLIVGTLVGVGTSFAILETKMRLL